MSFLIFCCNTLSSTLKEDQQPYNPVSGHSLMKSVPIIKEKTINLETHSVPDLLESFNTVQNPAVSNLHNKMVPNLSNKTKIIQINM